jgi:ribosome-associated protein
MKHVLMKELNAIAQAIYDKKGFNILALDVRGISTLTDYVIIAEGTIDRHLKALCYTIKDKLGELGQKPLYVEGEQSGEWIVLDFSDVVVHLFIPEYREKYALEQLWHDAKIVDVQIVTDAVKK